MEIHIVQMINSFLCYFSLNLPEIAYLSSVLCFHARHYLEEDSDQLLFTILKFHQNFISTYVKLFLKSDRHSLEQPSQELGRFPVTGSFQDVIGLLDTIQALFPTEVWTIDHRSLGAPSNLSCCMVL